MPNGKKWLMCWSVAGIFQVYTYIFYAWIEDNDSFPLTWIDSAFVRFAFWCEPTSTASVLSALR